MLFSYIEILDLYWFGGKVNKNIFTEKQDNGYDQPLMFWTSWPWWDELAIFKWSWWEGPFGHFDALTGIPSKISLVQNTDRKAHSAIMDASVGAAS